MLTSFGARSSQFGNTDTFAPYFLYRIGPYQSDFLLYFPKHPYARRYKNEIFNKLQEFTGHDLIRYLEFHFSAFSEKEDFLKFLHYEVSERLKRTPQKLELLSTREWIEDKRGELLLSLNMPSGNTTDPEMLTYLSDRRPEIAENLNQILVDFRQKFESGFQELLLEAEHSMAGLTSSYTIGRIELDSRSHEEKLIQLFILIQQIKAPGKAEQLFSKISSTDIAAILHLHFAAFQENKLTTVQRKLSEQTDRIKPDQAKIRRLTDALQDFFY